MTQRDVFISHSSGDAEVARSLRAVLEAAGYSCWMAPDDVVGTETWTEQILGAIADSKAMIVLVSTASNRSPHVSREVNLALGRSRAVLPIRIENVAPEGSLEYLLSLVQRVDAYPPPIDDHKDRILRRLGSIMERAERTTQVPAGDAAADKSETEPHETSTRPNVPKATPPTKAAAKARRPATPRKRASATSETNQVPIGGAPPGQPTADPVPPPQAIDLPPASHEPARFADAGTPGEPPAPPPSPPPAGPPSASPARRQRGQTIDIGPGTVIGGFTIESLLGEGGMASVYRARQEEPRRLVALKVIRADHAADETYRKRFLTETETLATLEHPSIIPIYAAGDSDGVLFIAMRLVDGPDLQGRITRQGRLSLRETVQILEPIADAVDYAHAMGIIHRDLKPSNIILDRAGRPYLTDFGLGKHLETDTNVSVPGMAIGTLDYMAPEQFSGPTNPELAPAIDLYAMGCVAFACLTGQPPFVRSTPQQLMYAHANEPPPTIRSIRPEYPPVVDEIFNKVLAKDPAARFGSAREFVSALESIVQSASAGLTSPVVVPQDISPATQARKWVSRNTQLAVAGGAIALVIAVILASGAIFGPPKPTAQPSQGAGGFTLPPFSQPAFTLPPFTIPPFTVPPFTAPPDTVPPVTAPPFTEPPFTTNPNGVFPNQFEAQLLSVQPPTVVDASKCKRLDDKYATATAMVFCPAPPGTDRILFYALFPDAAALTAQYNSIMGTTEVPTETTTGCFDLVTSNHAWSYGQDAEGAGLLGCYPRTDGDLTGIQYVWTHDRHRVMGLWLALDYQQGLDYFIDWATDIGP